MRHGSSAVRLVAVLLIANASTTAQQPSKPGELPDAPLAKESEQAKRQEPEGNPLKSTLAILERRSIFFPDLAASAGPLSSGQKFELFLSESGAPSRFLGSALGAGIGQARNSLPGYGQGMGGYGKRFGSSMATAASNNFFGTFLLPSMLRQDPRYFVRLHGSFWWRMGYALSRLGVTRTDGGAEKLNWSGIMGPLLAESLATIYLPEREQTAGKTFQRYGVRVGFGAATNVVKEYWPTIFKSLRISKIAPGLRPDPDITSPGPPGKKPFIR